MGDEFDDVDAEYWNNVGALDVEAYDELPLETNTLDGHRQQQLLPTPGASSSIDKLADQSDDYFAELDSIALDECTLIALNNTEGGQQPSSPKPHSPSTGRGLSQRTTFPGAQKETRQTTLFGTVAPDLRNQRTLRRANTQPVKPVTQQRKACDGPKSNKSKKWDYSIPIKVTKGKGKETADDNEVQEDDFDGFEQFPEPVKRKSR
jgi:hypothetical protein